MADNDIKINESPDLDLGSYLKQLSEKSRPIVQDRLYPRPETTKKDNLDKEMKLLSPRSISSAPHLGATTTGSSSSRKGPSPRPGCKTTSGINSKSSRGKANPSELNLDLSSGDGELYEGTHFTKEEGQKLHTIVTALVPKIDDKSEIQLPIFGTMMKNLSLSRCYMMERVFKVLDENKNGKITPEEFIRGLSILLRGSFEEQIRFAFKAYDATVTGFLTREDVTTCITESLYSTTEEKELSNYGRQARVNLPPESIQGLVDMIFPKLDADKDGMISFADFRSACLKDPTLVEALGPVMPKDCACHNAHRVGKGDISNETNNLNYLTRTSVMARLCTPVTTTVDRVLTAIDLKKQ